MAEGWDDNKQLQASILWRLAKEVAADNSDFQLSPELRKGMEIWNLIRNAREIVMIGVDLWPIRAGGIFELLPYCLVEGTGLTFITLDPDLPADDPIYKVSDQSRRLIGRFWIPEDTRTGLGELRKGIQGLDAFNVALERPAPIAWLGVDTLPIYDTVIADPYTPRSRLMMRFVPDSDFWMEVHQTDKRDREGSSFLSYVLNGMRRLEAYGRLISGYPKI